MNPPDRGEQAGRRLHLGLMLALAAGLALWLWRVYGFAPLRLVEPRP